MTPETTDRAILRFFREDLGGILITGEDGEVLYGDGKSGFVRAGRTNWNAACPPPRPGQKAETWDLLDSDSGKTYMVMTSSFEDGGGLKQIHCLTDTSLYMELCRDMGSLSSTLRKAKDHDGLTGLFNKGKFLEMKRSVFSRQERIAVFNLDVNDLKVLNDTAGHEAGDRLLRKAAESLRKIEARNVIPFRVGGDEFVVIAIHMTRREAEGILQAWRKGLEELNRENDGIPCVIACGFVYGEGDFDLEELLAEADRRMYEDKKKKKAARGQAADAGPQ